MKKTHWIGIVLTLLATLAVYGCGREGGEYTAEAEPAALANGALEAGPAIIALLAEADRLDGEEDKVVSKCTGCGLAMEGSSEFVLDVDDYSMHFCSDTCKDNVAENLEEAVMALEEVVMAMNEATGE